MCVCVYFLRQHVAFIAFLSVVGRDISDYSEKEGILGVWKEGGLI